MSNAINIMFLGATLGLLTYIVFHRELERFFDWLWNLREPRDKP